MAFANAAFANVYVVVLGRGVTLHRQWEVFAPVLEELPACNVS